jgi:hypothetical protein
LGIDRSELSPALQRKVVYAGTNNPSFQQGSTDLAELMHLEVNVKQVERVTERIGQERCAQRDREMEDYVSLPLTERKDKPDGVAAPEVAVVGVDGGRLQIRADTVSTDAPVATAGAEKREDEETLLPDEKHRGKHWREDKIALLMTMTSEEKEKDPCPEIPEVFVNPTRITELTRQLKTKKSASVEESKQETAEVADNPEEVPKVLHDEGQKVQWQPPEVKTKQLTATRRTWPVFGPMVTTLAWTLGFFQARRKAFIGDGSENNWTLWRNSFSSFTPILDIIHAISYVFAAAMAGRPFPEGWKCYERWVKWMWGGEVKKVIAEMTQRLAELGAAQDGDGDTHPRVVVGKALGYLQNHKDKMRYPEYRRLGLPITSSYVESAVKQFNQRVKGTEKFWTEEGAEALLQLRADYLCTTSPLPEFWQARQENATGQANYSQAA